MNTKPRIEILQKIVIGLFPAFARLVRQQALFKTPNSPPGFLCARSLNCAPLMSSTHAPLFMATIAGNVTPSFTICPLGPAVSSKTYHWMYEIRMEQLIGTVDAKLVESVLSVRRYGGCGSCESYGCRPCWTAGLVGRGG